MWTYLIVLRSSSLSYHEALLKLFTYGASAMALSYHLEPKTLI